MFTCLSWLKKKLKGLQGWDGKSYIVLHFIYWFLFNLQIVGQVKIIFSGNRQHLKLVLNLEYYWYDIEYSWSNHYYSKNSTKYWWHQCRWLSCVFRAQKWFLTNFIWDLILSKFWQCDRPDSRFVCLCNGICFTAQSLSTASDSVQQGIWVSLSLSLSSALHGTSVICWLAGSVPGAASVKCCWIIQPLRLTL